MTLALVLTLIFNPRWQQSRMHSSAAGDVGVHVYICSHAVCHARSQRAGEQLSLIKLQQGQWFQSNHNPADSDMEYGRHSFLSFPFQKLFFHRNSPFLNENPN